jgi:hypothetical protein
VFCNMVTEINQVAIQGVGCPATVKGTTGAGLYR